MSETNTQLTTEAHAEITALKSLLCDSDYRILKTLEGLLDCTSATAITTYIKNISEDIKTESVKRAEWRQRINEIEEEYPDTGETVE